MQLLYDILADNKTYFTYDNSGSAVGTSSKVWMFDKKDYDVTQFIIFVYNVMGYCVKNNKITSFKLFLYTYIFIHVVLFCMQ